MRIVFDLVQTWSIHEHSTHVLSHVIVPLLVEATSVQKNVIAACVILAINVHLIVRFQSANNSLDIPFWVILYTF